jgi:heparosan-N-sulfate-glucuronate 5-epimerase
MTLVSLTIQPPKNFLLRIIQQLLLTFMAQARWLVDHEVRLTNGASAWPMPFSEPLFYAQTPWLSALTQGNGISVLIRAYRLMKEDIFLEIARRAIRTFELDIRDGGVSTTVGKDGIFFEEFAAYPVAHILNGYIFSLFGLYDYVTLTNDVHIKAVVQRSVATLHTLIDKFDMHYWSYYDLLHKNPASHFYHDQHCVLLKALASYSGCEHCITLSKKWERYMHNPITYSCYFVSSRLARYRRGLQHLVRSAMKAKIQYASENPVSRLLAKPSEVS